MNEALTSSESVEWYTPGDVLEPVLELLGTIDLDPCSNSKTAPNVPATLHYTADDMGEMLPWAGKVFLNPPYGTQIGRFINKLIVEYECGDVTEALALVPARTDTGWFASLFRYHLCFWDGRLTFVGAKSTAPFPSVIPYLGPNVDRFVEVFGKHGMIVPPALNGSLAWLAAL